MVTGLGGVGWDINVHVPCVHTWMLRCCYVTGQGLGGVGWDINVHVPCVHTWMLRCCYVTEHNLLHEACNHSKGIFCITKKKHWGNLLVHTGGIDGMWKISKGAVSSSWSTRKDGAVNHSIASRNKDLAMAMAPWKFHWLPQSHRPRSEQTLGEVTRQRRTRKRLPARHNHKTL